MKKLLIVLALAVASNMAFADNQANSTAVAISGNTSQTQSPSVTGTVTATPTSDSIAVVNFNSPSNTTSKVEYSGTQTIKNTPSVNGPMLTTSNDTCMGSTSGSFNVAGLGIGGGTTHVDENCKILKNSRELWNRGMQAASMALMCLDPDNRYALEITGYVCPPPKGEQTKTESHSTASASPSAMLGFK